jgi:uncharacterized protein YcfL
MKSHILIGLILLFLSACASKNGVAFKQNGQQIEREDQLAHVLDAHSSRIR